MSVSWIRRLSDWIQARDPSGGYLLLSLTGYQQLLGTYGSQCFPQAIVSTFLNRLAPYEVADNDILVLENVMLVRLEHTTRFVRSDDATLEHIKAILSYEPIWCGPDRVLVNVLATWLEAGTNISLESSSFSSNLTATAKAIAFTEVGSQSNDQTRRDMAAVNDFFQKIRDAKVVLAFQPVVCIVDREKVLYYEALLRPANVAEKDWDAPYEMAIEAMERLHIVERLDSSVLWTVIQTLQQHPNIHLACNISSLSLRHSGWWRLICSVLSNTPDLASRLTLEITETAAVFDMDEAVNLLKTLRVFGCKIALKNVGIKRSAMELATRLRPNFKKIDKSVLHGGRTDGDSSLCSWAMPSNGLSHCMIVNGVETEDDLQLCINVEAHAVQGYFIEPPTPLPPWRTTPVTVQDSFNPSHLSIDVNPHISMN